MTATDHTSTGDRDLGPVIDDSDDDTEQLVSFQLPAYDSRNRRTLHPLIARKGMDADSVFGFMSPKVSLPKRIGAMKKFLLRSLVDDDGISIHEDARAVVKRDDEWVDITSLDTSPRASDVRFVIGDNTDWADEDDALEHARTHGSSLRRFAAIMDDETMRVKLTALQNAITHIVGEDGDRPTRSSKASSSSRKTPARSART